MSQISVKVKNVASGEALSVQVEPHATVGQLKQRVSYIVKTHEKQQILRTENHGELDNLAKLEDLGIGEGSEVELVIPEEKAEVVEAVVLSDDEGAVPAEAAELPAMPKLEARELSDAEMDEQASLKEKAADAAEDGDLAKAVELQTAALQLGPSAMMLCKRAEWLLKLKRPKAAAADASAALEMNPDSIKAFRIRGKARRQLGEYEAALKDLSEAQRADYDDGVEEVLRYVTARCEKLRKAARQA
mmetsp:Transcript_6727/g.11968  ORF Transcript_6727/g.11968 Transcript_6727/m.11968 type:complete len:246 (-) Transcript_6727:57-794(-)